MFPELMRKNQRLSQEECLRLLREETRGVLSVLGEGGYPYGTPMNHWYEEKDGCIYFHCGKSGHKNDAIARSDKASFCVMDQGFRREGEWALNIKSVVVFGRIQPMTDLKEAFAVLRQLCLKYTQEPGFFSREMAESGKNVLILRLVPEHITGKLVNES